MPGKNEIDELDYQVAVKLMDSIIIKKNHKLLEATAGDIEDSTLLCENPEIELIPMRNQIFYLMPEFLKDAKEDRLIELKKDIELYKEEYENLCNQINDFVKKTSDSLKQLIEPSKNLKKEIIKIIKQFETTVKNLCCPLISEQKGLDTIDINKLSETQKDALNEDRLSIDYKIKEFKEESENLNIKYNKLFCQINKAVQEICNNIKDIPPIITDLQEEIDQGMTKYEEILEEFSEPNNLPKFHNLLLKIKESFKLLINKKNKVKKQIDEKINNLSNHFLKRKESFIKLKEESKNKIDNLITKSNSIKNDILEVRKKNKEEEIKLPEIKITEIITKKTIDSMENSIELIKKVNEKFSKGICEINVKLENKSLDLLYLMDTTGSMEQYVKIIKEKLINILDNIIKQCIGVDINLGFIGFKDVIEHVNNNYLDKDFTQNYIEVKNEINSIELGGGDDTAEDVAWAFDRAIKKNWTSNAKLAILVTDAPCHGIIYHEEGLLDNYPDGVPNGKNIEDLVEKMALMNISLICIKLQNYTNKMYGIFKKIYKKHKLKNNCIFDIISIDSPKNLEKIILDNAVEVYKTQRFNENKENKEIK